MSPLTKTTVWCNGIQCWVCLWMCEDDYSQHQWVSLYMVNERHVSLCRRSSLKKRWRWGEW